MLQKWMNQIKGGKVCNLEKKQLPNTLMMDIDDLCEQMTK